MKVLDLSVDEFYSGPMFLHHSALARNTGIVGNFVKERIDIKLECNLLSLIGFLWGKLTSTALSVWTRDCP